MTARSPWRRLVERVREHGVASTARSAMVVALQRLLQRTAPHPLDMVYERRKELARIVEGRVGSRVAYGAFRRLQLDPGHSWGGAERSAMLLGLYEQEVVERLTALPAHVTTFIDIGAADGFFAIGALVTGRFTQAICYEMSDAGRRAIHANAVANGVAARVEVRGAAEPGFVRELPEELLPRSAVLVDIEGAEFTLLDHAALERLRHATVIVELHTGFVADGGIREAELRARAAEFFMVEEFTTGSRDLSGISEVRDMSDSDRWLLCSEGRPYRMSWLLLRPRGKEIGSSGSPRHQPA